MPTGGIRPDLTDEARRIKLKEAATLRAQFNYETAMRRIDHKLDVVEPRLKEVVRQITETGQLTKFVPIDGEIIGETEEDGAVS